MNLSQLIPLTDQLAFQYLDERWTYQEVHRCIGQVAEVIDRHCQSREVIVGLPNSPIQAVAVLSVIFSGRRCIPVDYRAGKFREQQSKVLFPGSVTIGSVDVNSVVMDGRRYKLNRDGGDPSGAEGELVLLTSGSSGDPKGIVYSFDQMIAAAQNIIQSCRLDRGNHELMTVSISHSDGWQRLMATLLLSGCVTILDETELPLKWFSKLDGVDSMFLPTPMVPLFLRLTAESILSMKSVEMGSTFIAKETLASLLERFPEVGFYYHYGLTECSRATTLDCRAQPDKLATVGQANLPVKLRVEEGEIVLNSPSMPNRHVVSGGEVEVQELWTGDQGALDEEGFLSLKGRSDQMISFGGHHTYPEEIRRAVLQYDRLIDAEIRVHRERASFVGEEVHIFVVLESDGNIEDLASFLPKYLRTRVAQVKMIERNSSGKFVGVSE